MKKKTPAKFKFSKLFKMFVILICNKVSNEWTIIFMNPKLPSKLYKIAEKVGRPWFEILVPLFANSN